MKDERDVQKMKLHDHEPTASSTKRVKKLFLVSMIEFLISVSEYVPYAKMGRTISLTNRGKLFLDQMSIFRKFIRMQ